MASCKEFLESSFHQLSNDARDLYIPTTIKELDTPPSPLGFLREYVMTNIPVVIRGGVQDWPAIDKWSDEYLSQLLGEAMVTVAMTPNGYADAPLGDKFVLPHEEKMKMRKFLEILNDTDSKDVVYIQKQNSSFTEEFDSLIPDACEEITWASEAFGTKPDAINFWMGDSRSITSTHKDPYENMYAVVRGAKHFILFPPVDLPYLPYELYTMAKFERDIKTSSYRIVDVRNEECCHLCSSEENVETNGKNNQVCNDSSSKKEKNDSLTEYTKIVDNSENEFQNRFQALVTEDGPNDDSVPKIAANENDNQRDLHNILKDRDVDNKNCNKSVVKPLSSCICKCHEPNKVPWIAINPLNVDTKHNKTYQNTNPLSVTLYPGDLLYLPSLWFHHVMQKDGTVAVNFWYDMSYDSKYAYFKFLETLSQPVLRILNTG